MRNRILEHQKATQRERFQCVSSTDLIRYAIATVTNVTRYTREHSPNKIILRSFALRYLFLDFDHLDNAASEKS